MANPIQPVTAQDALAVTKSDTLVYRAFAAVYVGTGGDVAIKTVAGNTVVYPDVPSGSILPQSGTQVLSTGTDASGLVLMFY